MILLPCQWCTGQRPDRPDLAEPAESRIGAVCPECGHTVTLQLCVLHALELRSHVEMDDNVHCDQCHAHPTHRCVPIRLTEETTL